MLKKSLMFFSVVFLAGTLILGCSSPTGPAGPAGQEGPPGTGTGNGSSGGSEQAGGGSITLTDELTTASIQKIIDDYSTIIITAAGLTQADDGVIYVSSSKNLTLDGDFTLASGGVLMIASANSLSGEGDIKTGTVVGDESLDGLDATLVPLYTKANLAKDLDKYKGLEAFGVLGDITVGATSSADINGGDLTQDTVGIYVIGKLTVSGDLSGKTGISFTATDNVTVDSTGKFTGDVTSTKDVITAAAITGDVTAKNVTVNTGGSITGDVIATGNVEASALITGAVDAGGKVTFTAAQTAITDLTAGSLSLGTQPLALTTSGTVLVKGAANLSGAFNPGGNVTFNGDTIITGVVTPSAPIELGGTGKVTLEAVLGDTSTNTITVKNTGGVTLTAKNTLAANLVATGVTIIGDTTTGVKIESDATNIVVPATDSITVPTTGTGLVVGDATETVTITGATLGEGTYTGVATGLTLGSTAEIKVAGGVVVTNTGVLTFADAATSKIILLEGGKLSALAGSDIKGSTYAKVKVLVAQKDAPTTATVGAYSAQGTDYKLTTGSSNAGNIIVGKIKWVIAGSAVVDQEGVTADTGNAAGTLTPGTDTTITIHGAA
jgi:hypothetical protein